MSKQLDVVKVLVALNILIFGASFFLNMEHQTTELFGLYFPKNDHFGAWQLLTSIFMHGSLMHLFFNMFALWTFGAPLLQLWGNNRFLLFYLVAGLGANLIYLGVNYYEFMSIYNDLISSRISSEDIQQMLNTGRYDTTAITLPTDRLQKFYQIYHVPAVGASGAIYGILVAFGITYPNVKLFLLFVPIPIPAKYFIPGLILLDLFSGVTGFSIFGGGIAHFAHVGGALIGFLLMWYWKGKINSRRPL